MKRKLSRGTPLEEAVTKGSLTYTVRQIRRAFYRQNPETESEYYWIAEIFADHVIVSSNQLADDEYYHVAYSREGDTYTFAERKDWEIVELTYQPQTIVERLRAQKGMRLDEAIQSTAVRLNEAVEGQPRVIHMDVAQADAINGNGRRYREAVLREAVVEARHHLHESLSQGRAILLGEAEHPRHKRQTPRLNETIVKWTDIWYDPDGWVRATGEMIENSAGRDAIVTMDAGVLPGGSLRGFGESEIVMEDGRNIQEVAWLRFTGIDLVMTPSFDDAGVTQMESLESEGDEDMADKAKTKEIKDNGAGEKLTAADFRAKHPELAEALVQEEKDKKRLEALRQEEEAEAERKRLEELNEARDAKLRGELGLNETDDLETAVAERAKRLQELEEAEARRQVDAHIGEQIAKLDGYPDDLKEQLEEAVALRKPTTVEEAKSALTEQRGIFDKVVANIRLKLKGYNGGNDVLGPVLEEGSVPAHLRAAHFLTESLDELNDVVRDPKRLMTIQEAQTAKILKAYDKKYKHHLAREAREFDEAEQTTDLNLPHSVARAVIEQAYPQLISTVVFDYDMVSQSPLDIFFEEYAGETGETGETGTVTDESFTSDHDAWVDLANARINYAGVVVTSDPAGTTYDYGDDYVVDYESGRIMVLSGGAMADATGFLIDYTYMAIRKGEMAGIERGKVKLSKQTLTMAADRLAQQVSDEAVVFSRSQLGWDATARTLNALIKEVVKKIDGDRLRMGLNSALTVASNSGGTWVSGTDTLDELVAMVGVAKVKVANRYYEPTAIVVSTTNSDLLSNWDGFTAAGQRPSDDLNANGYVGRLKGLPVFETTEFPDGYILVVNKELVMARVFQPMQIKGPFPSYDASTGELIAAEQYYVEEYNGSLSPIPGKGAYVVVS